MSTVETRKKARERLRISKRLESKLDIPVELERKNRYVKYITNREEPCRKQKEVSFRRLENISIAKRLVKLEAG